MKSIQRAVELLQQAQASVQEASQLVYGDSIPAWERDDWEAVLTEFTKLDTVYDGLLRKFGRRYLSKVTGKKVSSARAAILAYLRLNLGQPVTKEQLRVIAGIDEWPRRVRELRVEHGWSIKVAPGIHSTYYLADIKPNPEAKRLWKELNRMRRMEIPAQDRILTLMRSRLATPISVDDIEYVANVAEWKAELVKLRTEFGYRVSTSADRPELDDEYLLESEDLLPDDDEWDVPEELRRRVLDADDRRCTACGWEQDSSDDRWLEVHRRSPGSSLKDFASLCSICHDLFHARGPRAVAIKLSRTEAVRAVNWETFFQQKVSKQMPVHDAGSMIQRLLLPSVRIAGTHLPHIRELNALRENTLWHERVSRVVPLLEQRFGPVWYTKIGEALKPPLEGKSGDGFEHLMKYLIRQIAARDANTHVWLKNLFPGRTFPDAKQIDVYVPADRRPDAFLSLKWSLRGDRTHQLHLEAANLQAARPKVFFAVVTNEYDITRLLPLLEDPNISAVYHVDKAGVEAMWAPELEEVEDLRALSDISCLFDHLAATK